MGKSLADMTRQLFAGARNQDEIDRILSMPLTPLRLELIEAKRRKRFTQEEFDSFVSRLSAVGKITHLFDAGRRAIETGEVRDPREIEMNADYKQLYWTAVITRMMHTGDKPVAETKFWKQYLSTIAFHNEAITVANLIERSLQNDSATFGWGEPGSWFWQDRKRNHVNSDAYFMSLVGFDHARSIILHELGHSDLSREYPPQMKALFEKLTKRAAELSGKNDVEINQSTNSIDAEIELPDEMTVEDQLEIGGLIEAWNRRHRMWNAYEDITVNQYATNASHYMPQDMGYSLNHAGTVMVGFGAARSNPNNEKLLKFVTDLPPEEISDEKRKEAKEHILAECTPLNDGQIADIKSGNISPEMALRMFEQINRIGLLAGYIKNGLMNDTPENWASMRVFESDINALVDVSGLPDVNGRSAFRYLVEISAEGMDSIRNLQPQKVDRIIYRDPYKNIAENYRAIVRETNDKRNDIIDRIWNVYSKPFADVLVKQAQEQLKQRLEQQQQQQQEGKNDKGQKNDQSQQSQNGQKKGQKSQGKQQGSQGEGQGEGQPDPQSGDPSGEPGQGKGNKTKTDQKMRDDAKDVSGTPDQQRQKEIDKNNGKSAGKDKKNAKNKPENKDSDGGKDGKPEQSSDKSENPAKENGDKNTDDAGKPEKADGKGNENGQDGDKDQGKEKQGNGPGWGRSGQDSRNQPIKVSDAKNREKIDDRDLSEKEKEALSKQAENARTPDMGNLASSGAGVSSQLDLTRLAKGDWSNFNARMVELAPIITLLTASYKKIREEQKRFIERETSDLDLMPEDGDFMARLDRDKVLETKFKMAAGQEITVDDFKKFREDKTDTQYCSIEMVFMIDGSGSMPMMKLPGGVTAMEVAMQSAAIGYMACRKAGIDSYIIMWGDNIPKILAKPDTPLREVGENIETLRKGTGSGTSLAPAIIFMTDTIANYRNKKSTISGSTHILVFSDGEIADPTPTSMVLDTLARNAHNMSVDVAVITSKSAVSEMENVFKEVIQRTGDKVAGILRGNNPNQLPLELARLTLRRVKKAKIKGEPDEKKRKRLKALHAKFKK